MAIRLSSASVTLRWKGQRCKVPARGSLNSVRVEFSDGGMIMTSRNALKRADLTSKREKLPLREQNGHNRGTFWVRKMLDA